MEQPTPEQYVRKILLSPVYEIAKITPLQKMDKMSEKLGVNVLLKREDRQVVHSFKLRGAYNKIAGLSKEALARGGNCGLSRESCSGGSSDRNPSWHQGNYCDAEFHSGYQD